MQKINYKVLSVVVLGILIFCGVGFLTYRNFIRPVIIKDSQDDNKFSFYLQNPNGDKKHFEETTDWYEAKIDYPNKSKVVTDKIFSMWSDFAKENTLKDYTNLADAKKGLDINIESLKYSFIAEYSIATSTNYITYVYTIYNFTGGAHGSTYVFPITLNEKNEVVKVEDILPSNLLNKVSKISKIKILAEKIKRMGDYVAKDDTFVDEGVKPTRENYTNVWPVGDGDLMIDFGQYQVGSYAEGLYDIRISKSELAN